MKQIRIVTLGNWSDYFSHFLMGTMQGSFLNEALFRPVPLFGQTLNAVYEQITWFKPHLVFCHMIFNRQPHNLKDVLKMLTKLRDTGIKIAYHAGDARDTPRFPENISKHVDFVLINHWPSLRSYNVWQVPCYHWPYASCNQTEISEPMNIFKCDLAFTGNLGGNEHHAPRTEFIRRLKDYIKVAVFPTPESGNTRFQTGELSSSAKAVLGFQMGLEVPGYLDVRPFQYIGAGALYFHDECDAMNRFFISGKHYVAYKRDDINDFMKLYNHYVVKSPEEGNKIRQ